MHNKGIAYTQYLHSPHGSSRSKLIIHKTGVIPAIIDFNVLEDECPAATFPCHRQLYNSEKE